MVWETAQGGWTCNFQNVLAYFPESEILLSLYNQTHQSSHLSRQQDQSMQDLKKPPLSGELQQEIKHLANHVVLLGRSLGSQEHQLRRLSWRQLIQNLQLVRRQREKCHQHAAQPSLGWVLMGVTHAWEVRVEVVEVCNVSHVREGTKILPQPFGAVVSWETHVWNIHTRLHQIRYITDSDVIKGGLHCPWKTITEFLNSCSNNSWS